MGCRGLTLEGGGETIALGIRAICLGGEMTTKKKSAKGKAPAKAATRKTPLHGNDAEGEESQAATAKKISLVVPPHVEDARFPVVGMGASAGGLEALETFLEAVPPTTGMGFVLVVHLDPTHISIMPELLQKKTQMPVHQVKDGMHVRPNCLYVIPPNQNLSILHGKLHLLELVEPHGSNLPIDSFLRSLAQDQESHAIGIVFSGTGSDGTQGVKAIKGAAGMVMVQDEKSAKYSGMPHSAINTGLVDYVLPPESMAAQLVAYTHHAHHLTDLRDGINDKPMPQAMEKIFIILRDRTQHDFSLYKQNTIRRRIERRMSIHQITEIRDYVRYLQESDTEPHTLFKELLIGVTNFFRDPDAFKILQEKIIPELLRGRPDNYTLRVWVPGCSSGEECYSLAMVLHECMESGGRHIHVQIFGTDIDADAIGVARAGCYPESILADVGEERIQRYFTKEESGQYRISKRIREMLVFAPQNLIKDPPFTRLDLISCRNLLIYMNTELQRKLMPIFHYSLRPGGLLFLGTSETIGTCTELFDPLNRKWKVFRRHESKPANRSISSVPDFPQHVTRSLNAPVDTVRHVEELSARQLAETILRHSDTPPCVILDSASKVIYIHGRVGRYMELAEGEVSTKITQMVRPELRKELGSSIRQVVTHQQAYSRDVGPIDDHGRSFHVKLTVKPIRERAFSGGLIMVAFEETESPGKAKQATRRRGAQTTQPTEVSHLEQELSYVRESLETTIEELETSNEELKSTNEELQSTNEELQSTNEELETSKEELQSLNEESGTVNAELQIRNDQLSQTNDDVKNLLDATEIATLFLDTSLLVRRFTPPTTAIIPLAATDIGRPINDLTTTLLDTDLAAYSQQVLNDLMVREATVESKDARFYIMRVRPYRTSANVIDGAVLTFQDISALKQAQKEAQAAHDLAESIVATLREPLLILDDSLRVVSASRAFCHHFHVTDTATVGQLVYQLGNGQWDIPALRHLLGEILPADSSFDDYKVTHQFEGIGRRTMLLNARKLVHQGEQKQLILLAIEDVTPTGAAAAASRPPPKASS